jgi:hypothetical protein
MVKRTRRQRAAGKGTAASQKVLAAKNVANGVTPAPAFSESNARDPFFGSRTVYDEKAYAPPLGKKAPWAPQPLRVDRKYDATIDPGDEEYGNLDEEVSSGNKGGRRRRSKAKKTAGRRRRNTKGKKMGGRTRKNRRSH